MVKKISENEFEAMDKTGVLLVDFSAGWCGPCKMLAPVLDEVSGEYEGKIGFFNVDGDANPNLAESFGIQSIPALVILKDGKQQGMQIGFQPKNSLKEFLNQYV